MLKKITILLMAVLLLLGASRNVHAAERPDRDRKGSLTMVMEWEGQKLDSGSLTIYRVGQIQYVDLAWTFTLIPQLRDSGVSLENLNDSQLPQTLARLVKEKDIPGITAPVRDGKAVFEDLTAGLYLVTQEQASEGFSPINPFLMSLPQWEKTGYVYDFTARPKVSLEPLPTEPPETEPPETEPQETEPEESDEPELPQTGQLNWPVPVMALSGLMLLALGWYLCHGKKSSHES